MKYHVSNSLTMKNGYLLPKRPIVGLGGERLSYNQLSEDEINELANQKPTLTYGRAEQAAPESFIPAHVAFDKKVIYRLTTHVIINVKKFFSSVRKIL